MFAAAAVADQVTAEFCNFGTGTAVTTASQSFNIRVIKQAAVSY
jgi:hypothetical protein